MPRVGIEDRVVKLAAVPAGARFKGYSSDLVQDLVLHARVIRDRRERWLMPDGRMPVAPRPASVVDHSSPELRRFVLLQHHQGQVTVERLVAQLRAIGLSISTRQVMRLLNAGQDGFLAENREVLRAGLQTATWITVDDTGARHAGQNGVCTQIGNDTFAWFGTPADKSRANVLELRRAGHTDYVVNDAALAYMRGRALAGSVIARLAEPADNRFTDAAAWQAHLERLGITALRVTPDPTQIATAGALWGSIQVHGFVRDAVIVSDGAGQFAVGEHALCWVHAERLGHKLDTFTDRHRAAAERLRALIWWFHADLKAYRRSPTARRRGELRARCDRIFRRGSGFATLDRLLKRLHANKSERLRVLDRPNIPLNTNGSERHPRSRHQAQDQRRNAQRCRSPAPICQYSRPRPQHSHCIPGPIRRRSGCSSKPASPDRGAPPQPAKSPAAAIAALTPTSRRWWGSSCQSIPLRWSFFNENPLHRCRRASSLTLPPSRSAGLEVEPPEIIKYPVWLRARRGFCVLSASFPWRALLRQKRAQETAE